MFNAIDALFAPGRKHSEDEKRRLEMTREQAGDNDPGRGPIDLSSGKVVVRVPGSDTAPAAPTEPQEADAAAEPQDTDPSPDPHGADPRPGA
ncbi:DUF6191 domain-containing protein [Streptomyces tsukubensis]|uniref:Regulatory protein n=1 Tax=Streptomyces tsukubensis TaxID=83656 RepID=A0A1V4A957_9ACTN|nr:DUF6191 domain-containing protein [Streptomyces tsukubensis]OON79746.1 hypothetical protein B1H18_14110 [Streptomyces tsukubensis]QFR95882.1 hypothetical protein GBW32_26135 [Streptomyces tsukubensis]